MKISGELKFQDDGTILHVEKFSDSAAFSAAEQARAIKKHKGGKLLDFVSEESTPQYSYPLWLEQMWSNRWKVRMDDPAFDDIVQLELNSGQYEKFRI
jgi:hypothetical protein